MTPKISVIIPVYNTEEYLPECLDSVLMQTFGDIEVICVDDGSKDDCLSILQTYALWDDRLQVIASEHSGPAAACNKGLSVAKGEYICFLNSYDLFDPNMLEKMLQQAQTDQSDVVLDRYDLLNQSFKEFVKTPKWAVSANSPCRPQDLSDELFRTFPTVVWNKLIRADLVHKYDLQFDETVHHMADQAFNAMLLAGADKISWMNDSYICHRTHFKENHPTDLAQQFEDGLKVFAHLFRKMHETGLDGEFDIPYYFWLKYFIWESLDALPTDKRAQGVRQILKQLPDKVLNHLICPSKYEQKVSVIVPVYNAAEFLPECLDSLIGQTLKDIEIICVNDGSTDNSLEILNAYAQNDSRIKVLSQENSGRTVARNNALQEASGTYIQFVDADDYLAPDACELLYAYARIFSLDMLSFSAVEFKHKTREEFEDPYHTLSWLPERFSSVFGWTMLTTDMPKLSVTACLTLYRRMYLLKNGIQWMAKKVVFEDTPFFVEAAFRGGRMGALNAPLYYRRVHPNATTQQMAVYFHDLIFVYKHTLNMLEKMHIPKQIVKAYATVFFEKVYQNYLRFEPEDKQKQVATLYDFCLYMLKEYHLQFSKTLLNWVCAYLKPKKMKKKMTFGFYWLRAKMDKARYVVPFFEFQRLPDFSIRIFGVPLIEIQVSNYDLYSMNCKIFGLHFVGVKETQSN